MYFVSFVVNFLSVLICVHLWFIKTMNSLNDKRKRLIFRSHHRGTKEMDLIMGTFADQNIANFNEEQLAQYEELLNIPDLDLYNWITGKEETPANVMNPVLESLLQHQFAA